MAESQVKSGRRGAFVVVMQEMLFDQRLTLRTRAIFAMMLSLPDNWDYTISGLAVKCGVSKDTIRDSLNQMEKAGYLLREQTHGERGRFGGNVYVLQDYSSPLSENTDNGEHRQRKTPSSVNSTQVNKDLSEKRQKKPPTPSFDPMPLVREAVGQYPAVVDAMEGLLENRKAFGKPVKTKRTLDGILHNLAQYSKGDPIVMAKMIEKAIVHNWQTVYELKAWDTPTVSTDTHQIVEENGVTYL